MAASMASLLAILRTWLSASRVPLSSRVRHSTLSAAWSTPALPAMLSSSG